MKQPFFSVDHQRFLAPIRTPTKSLHDKIDNLKKTKSDIRQIQQKYIIRLPKKHFFLMGIIFLDKAARLCFEERQIHPLIKTAIICAINCTRNVSHTKTDKSYLLKKILSYNNNPKHGRIGFIKPEIFSTNSLQIKHTIELELHGYATQLNRNSEPKMDPIAQFHLWQKDANTCDNTAAVLATSTINGTPYARTVLVKSVTPSGFTFYTNINSNKGRNLTDNPKAAMVFYWDKKQVIIRGNVLLVDKEEANANFALRPRKSRAVTTLSRQSKELENEELFLHAVEKLTNSTEQIMRPEHWVGFCLKPHDIEFFTACNNRLNKRFLYTLQPDGKWKVSQLYP